MDLRTYFSLPKAKAPSLLATEIGVSAETVRLWTVRRRMPKPARIDDIIEATNGKVTRSGLRPDLYPPRKQAA